MENNEPELEFWDHIPTSWDETKVLQGSPGEYITTARRKGQEWFVGTLGNNEARTVKIDCSFLPKGNTFTAKIYTDDPSVSTNTKVKVQEKKITASTVLEAKLLPSGGQAIWIKP